MTLSLDLDRLEADVAADTEGYDEEIAANQAAQSNAGHWGVPLMVFDGEPFFGQDRIDALLWRMRNAGLKERTGGGQRALIFKESRALIDFSRRLRT